MCRKVVTWTPLARGTSRPSRRYAVPRHAKAVRAGGNKIAASDLIRMVTDRSKFPPAEQLTGRWGAVRIPGRGGPALRLAELTFFRDSDDNGPARPEVETFEHHPMKVRRITVDEYPGGKLEVSRRTVLLAQTKGDGAGKRRRKRWAASILQPQVVHDETVSLSLLPVRRYIRLDSTA